MADTSDWETKEQAAQRLGMAPRSLERLISDGTLETTMVKQVGARSFRAVLKASTDALIHAREQQHMASNPHLPMVRAVGELAQSLQQQETASSLRVPLDKKIYLDLREARAFSGLSMVYLRRLMDKQQLKFIRDGQQIKFRRGDLEKL